MKRIEWIDNLRGLGILFVIFGHNSSILNHYIYSFHMPLFFFLSGLLFKVPKKTSTYEYFIKKARSLLIPYTFFAIIFYSIWLIFERNSYLISIGLFESKSLTYSSIDNLIGIFYSAGGNSFMDWGPHMWFLPCLFVVIILFYFLSKFNKTIQILGLSTFCLLGYYYNILNNTIFPWSINIAFVGVLFYGFGFFIKNHIQFLAKNKMWLLFFSIGLSAFAFVNNRINMRDGVFNNYAFFLLAAAGGIILYTTLFYNTKQSKILKYFGQNSLLFFILHLKFMPIAWSIPHIPNLFPYKTGILSALYISSIEIILCIPLIFIINKYFPMILGKIPHSNSK